MNDAQVFREFTKDGQKRWELGVRLTPKSSQTKIGHIAWDAERKPYLKVYVTAVPEGNKANKALLVLLSKTFHVPKTRLHIISGLTDRRKVIQFEEAPWLNEISN